MPLELSDGARVGSLAALSRERGRFRADHEQLLGMLARVLAYELERETNERDLRRLNDSLRDQARGMAAVGRAARALAGDGDPKRRGARGRLRGRRRARSPSCSSRPGRELVSTAMHGVEMAPVTIQPARTSRAAPPRRFAALESYFVADARDHPALAAPLVDATAARSALFEPVVREGNVAGVIILVWREHGRRAVGLAERRAAAGRRQAAVAIEHAGLRGRLGALALSDPLTGLATRGCSRPRCRASSPAPAARETPVCVAVLDLDHLGAFNMLRGEREGDRLLKETAVAVGVGAARRRPARPPRRRRVRGAAARLRARRGRRGVDRVRARTPRAQTASAGVARGTARSRPSCCSARAQEALAAAKAAGRDVTVAGRVAARARAWAPRPTRGGSDPGVRSRRPRATHALLGRSARPISPSGDAVSASRRRAARIAASRAAAASSVQRQLTPASIVNVGCSWSWTSSTSSRTATVPCDVLVDDRRAAVQR